ncbi:MAG: IS200/IS605 family accessory protein TnpB-related protein [Clostridia bacterium]|nr:IS200/IS605 family accessory protein TnpB-related protein [Clostridia bacterium]
MNEQDAFSKLTTSFDRLRLMEQMTISTKDHPYPKYDFGASFYKFPAYYRRAAINEALGKAESYLSLLKRWEETKQGTKPGIPKAGFASPSLYRDNTFVRESDYTARVKVWIRNTWDWVTVRLKKGDADYILHHCKDRKECVPTLKKRGKEWFLDFAFEESVTLNKTGYEKQIIVAVDLGILNACTCTVMKYDGTILGRSFLKLPREQDCLNHAVNRIKKAQQHGARKTPRLWAAADGMNDRIAVRTAEFIMNVAVEYNATTIVLEHLDKNGKKKGSKKQRLALWKSNYVQAMVSDKAHRLGIRISRVNAWNTSRLAFDGSGRVIRGRKDNRPPQAEAGKSKSSENKRMTKAQVKQAEKEKEYEEGRKLKSYSLCKFKSGKVYNCDLNASYNIGARYFIREILKSLPATVRLDIEAKVPECSKRNTCTLSTLINLNAGLVTISS